MEITERQSSFLSHFRGSGEELYRATAPDTSIGHFWSFASSDSCCLLQPCIYMSIAKSASLPVYISKIWAPLYKQKFYLISIFS